MKPPFLILSLPRSRSYWLSRFLAYDGRAVGHDLAVGCASIAEFEQALDKLSGTCETGAMLAWRLLRRRWPEAKILTVRRRPQEVIASFAALGMDIDPDQLAMRDGMLDLIEKDPQVWRIEYPALDNEAVAEGLFQHCLGIDLDWNWWHRFRHWNLQIDMRQRLQDIMANSSRIENLKNEIIAETVRLGPSEQWMN